MALDPSDQAQLAQLRLVEPLADDVLRQLDRVLLSATFRRVQQRSRDFLIFVVGKLLLGQADTLKETVVAMGVFDEPADFDSKQTSKVRVAAGALRDKLTEYAEGEGSADPLEITLPVETYVPEVKDRRVAVEILDFANWHPDHAQSYLCVVMEAELNHLLRGVGLRIGRRSSFPCPPIGPVFTLRGSIEPCDDLVRINISLAQVPSNRILCSKSFEGARDDILKLARGVSEALLDVLPPSARLPVHVPNRRRP